MNGERKCGYPLCGKEYCWFLDQAGKIEGNQVLGDDLRTESIGQIQEVARTFGCANLEDSKPKKENEQQTPARQV